MAGFAWISGCLLAGKLMESLLPVPLPGNVTGMLLLFILLQLKWIKLNWVESAASFLLSHMMLFFVPVIVGVMGFFPYLEAHIWPIAAAIVPGTLLVIGGAGYTVAVVYKNAAGKEVSSDDLT